MIEIAVALGAVLSLTVTGGGYACYRWGRASAQRDLLELKEAQQHEAMDVLAGPAPLGGDLLERL